MSDFAEVYGILFAGFALVMVFLSVYRVVSENNEIITLYLSSDYLASKFKGDLPKYSSSIEYNNTFAVPRFDPFTNEIFAVISSE